MTDDEIELPTLQETHGHERDSSGCFLGCYSHGCSATRCGDMKEYWRRAVAEGEIVIYVENWGEVLGE